MGLATLPVAGRDEINFCLPPEVIVATLWSIYRTADLTYDTRPRTQGSLAFLAFPI